MDLSIFTLLEDRESEISPHDPERARPARFIKEVNDDVRQEPQSVACAAHLVLVGRSGERPVDEHGMAD
jgi:hypothetical protein